MSDSRRTFAEAVIGEEFEPTTVTVTVERVKRFADVPGLAAPWWLDRSLNGEPVVPAMAVEGAGMERLNETFRIGSGVMANISYECFRPLRIGETLVGRSHIADKYERRGRNYVVLKTTIADEAGQTVFNVERAYFQRAEEFETQGSAS